MSGEKRAYGLVSLLLQIFVPYTSYVKYLKWLTVFLIRVCGDSFFREDIVGRRSACDGSSTAFLGQRISDRPHRSVGDDDQPRRCMPTDRVSTAAQAAQALAPLTGKWASILFVCGIIETGMLAIPVLAGSAAYAVGEGLNWGASLEKKPKEAAGFYVVIAVSTLIGIALNFIGIIRSRLPSGPLS